MERLLYRQMCHDYFAVWNMRVFQGRIIGNVDPETWKCCGITYGLIQPGVITSWATASCDLSPRWPEDLGFGSLNFWDDGCLIDITTRGHRLMWTKHVYGLTECWLSLCVWFISGEIFDCLPRKTEICFTLMVQLNLSRTYQKVIHQEM